MVESHGYIIVATEIRGNRNINLQEHKWLNTSLFIDFPKVAQVLTQAPTPNREGGDVGGTGDAMEEHILAIKLLHGQEKCSNNAMLVFI